MQLLDLDFSDIYLFDQKFMIKVKGNMSPLEDEYLPDALKLKAIVDQEVAKGKGPNFSISHNSQRYRAEISNGVSSNVVALRKVQAKIFSWEMLGFPKHLLPVILSGNEADKKVKRGGLILIGGKTDSGKSTTAYSIFTDVLRRMPWYGITIEDPVETLIEEDFGNGSMVHQQEVNPADYDEALKSALRSNCDIVLVGEIRTQEAAELALQAAQTGHLVITTIHGNSTIQILERLLDVLGGDSKSYDLLGSVLRSVIWQSLEKHEGLAARSLSFDALINDTSVSQKIKHKKLNQLVADVEQQQNKNYRLATVDW